MRFLIPEIASSISFFVTLFLFSMFMYVLWGVFGASKESLEKNSNLPFED